MAEKQPSTPADILASYIEDESLFVVVEWFWEIKDKLASLDERAQNQIKELGKLREAISTLQGEFTEFFTETIKVMGEKSQD